MPQLGKKKTSQGANSQLFLLPRCVQGRVSPFHGFLQPVTGRYLIGTLLSLRLSMVSRGKRLSVILLRDVRNRFACNHYMTILLFCIYIYIYILRPNFTTFNVPCRGSAETSTYASKVLHHKDSLARTQSSRSHMFGFSRG